MTVRVQQCLQINNSTMTALKLRLWTMFLLAHWSTLIHAVLRQVDCTQTEVTVNASVGDTLQICCHVTLNKTVEWSLTNASLSPPVRRIFDNGKMMEAFNRTGRFHVSQDSNGYFNLTIINVSVSDSVPYECMEDDGRGKLVRVVFLNVTDRSSSSVSVVTISVVAGILVSLVSVVGFLFFYFLKAQLWRRKIQHLWKGIRRTRGTAGTVLLNQMQASTKSKNAEPRPRYNLNVNLVEELVSGLVYVNGTVFFCNFNQSDVWKVNLFEKSFAKKSLIRLEGALSLRSMALYSESSQILVADHDGKCIWKLSLSPTSEEHGPFIKLKRNPMAITVKADRLLVTSKHNITLIDMKSRNVLMDQDFDDFIIYSVECPSKHDRFYVCEERKAVYRFDYTNDNRTNKVEFQVDFNKPRCLIIDKNGNIIVADHFNHRLVVIGRDMRVRKEIKYTQAEFVNRLYYDQGENLLLVGFQSNGIKIYDMNDWLRGNFY